MDPMLEPRCSLTGEGRAISATFAEDGVEPETCHLCFSAPSLKARVRTHVRARVSACQHALGVGRIISRHLLRRRWRGPPHRDNVSVRAHGRGGEGRVVPIGILRVIRGKAASKCMWLLIINVTADPFGYANVF